MCTLGGAGRERRSLHSQWTPELGRLDTHRVEAACQEALQHAGEKQLYARPLGRGALGVGSREPGQGSLSPQNPRLAVEETTVSSTNVTE